MNLSFNTELAKPYHSASQITRVLTETWVQDNLYCPRCGNMSICKFENNRPVADFFCPKCLNQYELKSKSSGISKKINDGAYKTMIQRITSNQNPDFLFMGYSKSMNVIDDLIIVPKHFFTPEIIEKRKPLAPSARRAGWIGCNILLSEIPEQGRIPIIKHGEIIDYNEVLKKVCDSTLLMTTSIDNRGWLMDILNCINTIDNKEFSLSEIYLFENELRKKHPHNHNVKPKIRQQLQFLRDKGFIKFLGNGMYMKLM